MTAAMIAVAVVVSGGSPQRALAQPAHLPSNVTLEQWSDEDGAWITGALQKNNSSYHETEVVPFQLTIPANVDPGEYSFDICYEYRPATASMVRGYLYLDAFNTSRAAVPTGGAITATNGALRGINVELTSFTDTGATGGDCDADEHRGAVTINKLEGTGYVLWGGHLAGPSDPGVGIGNGASNFSGGSLHMRLGTPDKSVGIQTGAIIPAPTLTVIKHVINDNGGTLNAADFTMRVTAVSPSQDTFAGSESGVTISLLPGAYSVDEDPVPGYTKTIGEGCVGTIAAGESATCTITNDDNPPPGALKVVKEETGVLNAPAWNFALSGGPTSRPDQVITGSGETTFTGLQPGSYTVTETNGIGSACSPTAVEGSYSTRFGATNDPGASTLGTSMASITVEHGTTATVYFFNDGCAVAGTSELVIRKFEDPAGNRTGSTAIGGFQFAVAKDGVALAGSPFTAPADGSPIVLPGLVAGQYTVTETVPAGWQLTGSKADLNGDHVFEADYSGQPAPITLVANGDVVHVNFYNRGLGSLVVEKQTLRNGANEPAQNGGWHITISSTACNFSATGNTVQGSVVGAATFSNIPACSDYQVTENANSKPGLVPAFAPVGSTTRTSVVVARSQVTTVRFVNARSDAATPTPTATNTPETPLPTETSTPVPTSTTPPTATATATATPTSTPEKTAILPATVVPPTPPSAGTGHATDGGPVNALLVVALVMIGAGAAGMWTLARRKG